MFCCEVVQSIGTFKVFCFLDILVTKKLGFFCILGGDGVHQREAHFGRVCQRKYEDEAGRAAARGGRNKQKVFINFSFETLKF
jgi:hypothetical protein